MKRRVKYVQPAPTGSTFAPNAFASQIGKTLPMTLEGSSAERDCKLIAAEVSEDGTSVEFTLEVDDDAFPPEIFSANGLSIVEGTEER